MRQAEQQHPAHDGYRRHPEQGQAQLIQAQSQKHEGSLKFGEVAVYSRKVLAGTTFEECLRHHLRS
jgi:hypothetical protein